MKRQILILSMLLLSGCPTAPKNTELKPDESPLAKVSAFPQDVLGCCWSELELIDKNYAQLALDAYNGSETSLAQLLKRSIKMSPQTSHLHGVVLATILQHMGDQRFAYYLQEFQKDGGFKPTHPLFEESLLDTIRNELEAGFTLAAAPISQNSLSDFAQTAILLGYQTVGKKTPQT